MDGKERVEKAIGVAVEHLKKAYNAISEAVDSESTEFDRILSYAYEIEDMIDNLNARKGVY